MVDLGEYKSLFGTVLPMLVETDSTDDIKRIQTSHRPSLPTLRRIPPLDEQLSARQHPPHKPFHPNLRLIL